MQVQDALGIIKELAAAVATAPKGNVKLRLHIPTGSFDGWLRRFEWNCVNNQGLLLIMADGEHFSKEHNLEGIIRVEVIAKS